MKSQKGTSGIEVLISIALCSIFLIVIWILNLIWNSYSCSNYGKLTERQTKYSVINGCFVKTETGWIPQEEMSKRAYGNSIVESE